MRLTEYLSPRIVKVNFIYLSKALKIYSKRLISLIDKIASGCPITIGSVGGALPDIRRSDYFLRRLGTVCISNVNDFRSASNPTLDPL